MQDQYAGDIGDFVKYGLLRAISEGKCLGVAWYLCTDSGSTKRVMAVTLTISSRTRVAASRLRAVQYPEGFGRRG